MAILMENLELTLKKFIFEKLISHKSLLVNYNTLKCNELLRKRKGTNALNSYEQLTLQTDPVFVPKQSVPFLLHLFHFNVTATSL
jgi:hypothetical protein